MQFYEQITSPNNYLLSARFSLIRECFLINYFCLQVSLGNLDSKFVSTVRIGDAAEVTKHEPADSSFETTANESADLETSLDITATDDNDSIECVKTDSGIGDIGKVENAANHNVPNLETILSADTLETKFENETSSEKELTETEDKNSKIDLTSSSNGELKPEDEGLVKAEEEKREKPGVGVTLQSEDNEPGQAESGSKNEDPVQTKSEILLTESKVPPKTENKVSVKKENESAGNAESKVPVKLSKEITPVADNEVQATSESEGPQKAESEVPLTPESELPSKTESEVPTKTVSEVPPKTASEVPLKTESEVPPKTASEVPLKTESEIPLKTEREVPPKTESEVPQKIESEVPPKIESEVEAKLEKTPDQKPKSLVSLIFGCFGCKKKTK